MSPRMSLAAEAGAFADAARVLLIQPPRDVDLSLFGEAEITVEQDMMPDAETWPERSVRLVRGATEPVDIAVIFLPRAKAAARDVIARAAQLAKSIVIDGQKTDGVEAMLKDLRRRVPVSDAISKAHGKLFWFDSDGDGADFSDWRAEPSKIDARWHVAPGVFSADGIDPGSALLAEALPTTLKGRIADLGAGWGFLAGRVLERSAALSEVHLVEAQGRALDCARRNVTDPRARFHWADATTWQGERNLDAVIMNPPFHSGRSTDTDLGRAFIASAARLLRPGGVLWMVANRHLAYEQTLRDTFAEVAEHSGDGRYKVIRATKAAERKRKS